MRGESGGGSIGVQRGLFASASLLGPTAIIQVSTAGAPAGDVPDLTACRAVRRSALPLSSVRYPFQTRCSPFPPLARPRPRSGAAPALSLRTPSRPAHLPRSCRWPPPSPSAALVIVKPLKLQFMVAALRLLLSPAQRRPRRWPPPREDKGKKGLGGGGGGGCGVRSVLPRRLVSCFSPDLAGLLAGPGCPVGASPHRLRALLQEDMPGGSLCL